MYTIRQRALHGFLISVCWPILLCGLMAYGNAFANDEMIKRSFHLWTWASAPSHHKSSPDFAKTIAENFFDEMELLRKDKKSIEAILAQASIYTKLAALAKLDNIQSVLGHFSWRDPGREQQNLTTRQRIRNWIIDPIKGFSERRLVALFKRNFFHNLARIWPSRAWTEDLPAVTEAIETHDIPALIRAVSLELGFFSEKHSIAENWFNFQKHHWHLLSSYLKIPNHCEELLETNFN